MGVYLGANAVNVFGGGSGEGGGGAPSLQSKTYTVSGAGTATVTADSGYDGLSSVAVSVPSATPFVGNRNERFYDDNGTRRWGIDTFIEVDASEGDIAGWLPDGYSQVLPLSRPAVPSNTTITPTTSAQTVGGAKYMMEGAVTVAAMPSGTAGTPTATKGTVSNHSISVTPKVTNSAGYIAGSTKTGTAVTVSASELVSGTLPLTDNGTADCTNYASVNVNIPFVTYYTGSSTPASSLGSNGDIYLKVVS